MSTTSRRGAFARLPFHLGLLLLSAHCRCQYEVLAAPSDGSVNDGSMNDGSSDGATDADAMMPPTITLAASQSTNRKGSAIGTSFSEACGADQVLVGLDGYVQEDGFELLTAVRGNCGTLHVQGDGSVLVQAGDTLPMYGDTNFAIPFTLQCPPNQVVVGFEGNAGTAIDSATIQCAPLTVEGGMVVVGTATAVQPAPGGTMGTPYDEPCQLGKIARGRFGYYDSILQGLGLICATPTVVP